MISPDTQIQYRDARDGLTDLLSQLTNSPAFGDSAPLQDLPVSGDVVP